jgi:hypothetical protein
MLEGLMNWPSREPWDPHFITNWYSPAAVATGTLHRKRTRTMISGENEFFIEHDRLDNY